MRTFLLTTLFLAAGAALATARDSWAPYGQKRLVAPGGRFYVVVRAKVMGLRGAEFELVQRAQDAPPATAAGDGYFYDRDEDAEPPADSGGRLEGDLLLAKGTLPQAPITVHVSPTGRGFVAIEQYGQVGYGQSVIAVDADGEQRFALELSDLFDEARREAFTHTVSSIWWRRGSWVDEAADEIVLVTGTTLRAVDLASGEVRPGGKVQVRRAIGSLDPTAQALAIELARELGLAGLEERLVELCEDAAQPAAVRLRAAAALADGGDLRGRGLCLELARHAQAQADRAAAIAELAKFLPEEEAIATLRELLEEGGDAWWPSIQALAALGTPAVPTLLAVLQDEEGSADSRGGAAHALKELGAPAALPSLLAAVEDESKYVANAALNAAIEIGGESIAGKLAAILERGSTQDGRLAGYFGKVRHPAAPAAIRSGLARHPGGSYEHRRLSEALAFQEAGR